VNFLREYFENTSTNNDSWMRKAPQLSQAADPCEKSPELHLLIVPSNASHPFRSARNLQENATAGFARANRMYTIVMHSGGRSRCGCAADPGWRESGGVL